MFLGSSTLVTFQSVPTQHQIDIFTMWSQNVIPCWNFLVFPTLFGIKSKLLTVALKALPDLGCLVCLNSYPVIRYIGHYIPINLLSPTWLSFSPRSLCHSTQMSLSQRPSFNSLSNIFPLISFYPIILLYFLQIT